MPILYNPLAFGEKSLKRSSKVFVCRYLLTNKIALLCVLCDSAVNAYNFILFLITPYPSDEKTFILPSGSAISGLRHILKWLINDEELIPLTSRQGERYNNSKPIDPFPV
jgi:hypothetical protein